MNSIRKLAASASLLALAVAGCTGDTITTADSQSLQALTPLASASVARPWKGVCDVQAAFTSQTTLLITGTCQIAHMGRVTVVANQTIIPGPVIGYTNTAEYTAANGDVLNTTNVGTATPTATGLVLAGTETAVGGTGRFANASGTAYLNGAVAFTGPSTTSGSYSIDGIIEY